MGVKLVALHGFKQLLIEDPACFNDTRQMLCPPLSRNYYEFNISHHLWIALIKNGCPFVKKNVLFDYFYPADSFQVALLFELFPVLTGRDELLSDIMDLMRSRLLYPRGSKSLRSIVQEAIQTFSLLRRYLFIKLRG
jgi:hypothetical protein